MSHRVLVVALAEREVLGRVPLELIAAAQPVAQTLGCPVEVLLLAAEPRDFPDELIAHGAARVHLVLHAALADYEADRILGVLEAACRRLDPSILLLGGTPRGIDLAPRLACRLGVGLVTDCLALRAEPDRGLVMVRPAYGGRAQATMTARGRPQMATLWPHTASPLPRVSGARGEVIPLAVPVESAGRTRIVARTTRDGSTVTGPALEEARIVVSGGRGLGGPEGFATLERLARALGGAVGASRAATDAGWVRPELQVGQTGKTVSPDLYIAVGISGAAQHLAGIGAAKHVLAINSDPDAPIFRRARFGLVGDWAQIVPALIDAVVAAKRPATG